MKTADFTDLATRILSGVADEQERKNFVAYAIDLRITCVELISNLDEWDRNWDVLGYEAYSDEGDEEFESLMVWFKEKK